MRTVSMDAVAFFWDMYLTMAISKDSTPTPPVLVSSQRGLSDCD
jgi:hypothetical protein